MKTVFGLGLWSLSKNLSITPKALANFSPGLERSDNPGLDHHMTYEP